MKPSKKGIIHYGPKVCHTCLDNENCTNVKEKVNCKWCLSNIKKTSKGRIK